MDERFDRLDLKLDKLGDRLASIDNTLVRQQVILDEHVKRSTQLEDRIIPVEEHITGVKFLGKIVMGLSILISIITGIAKIFKLL